MVMMMMIIIIIINGIMALYKFRIIKFFVLLCLEWHCRMKLLQDHCTKYKNSIIRMHGQKRLLFNTI